MSCLPENAVVVIDNAHNNCKVQSIQTTLWKKGDTQDCLSIGNKVSREYGQYRVIEFDKLTIEKYVVDETTKPKNRTVVFLPTSDCGLKPIELGEQYDTLFH